MPTKPKIARRPPVVSCSGPTPTARLARTVAAHLSDAEDLPPLEADLVVIDGCASACASRRLAGRNVRPVSLQLEDLGFSPADDPATADVDVLVRLAGRKLRRRPSGRRRRRPAPPAAAPSDGRRAHTSRDYLLALYTLTTPVVACGARATDLPTLAAYVARSLAVSRASAGEMVARLEREGLIEHGPAKEILLTPAGHEAAGEVVRRHRLVELLLTDVLGYTVAESCGLALQIREGCDDTLIEHIARTVSTPARCPHGWPVDVAEETRLAAELVSLPTVPRGGTASIVALVEDDASALTRLDHLGVRLDVDLRVLGVTEVRIAVDLAGARLELDRGDASSVLVRQTSDGQAGDT